MEREGPSLRVQRPLLGNFVVPDQVVDELVTTDERCVLLLHRSLLGLARIGRHRARPHCLHSAFGLVHAPAHGVLNAAGLSD